MTLLVIFTGRDSELISILADTGAAEDHFPDPAKTSRETAALMGNCGTAFSHPGGLYQRFLRRGGRSCAWEIWLPARSESEEPFFIENGTSGEVSFFRDKSVRGGC